MKILLISVFMIVSFGLAGNSAATSPQPEEVRPGQTVPVCTTHIVYIMDLEKGITAGDSSSTFVFETSEPKKEVLERIYKHLSSKLNEGNVSEFRIECKFPK